MIKAFIYSQESLYLSVVAAFLNWVTITENHCDESFHLFTRITVFISFCCIVKLGYDKRKLCLKFPFIHKNHCICQLLLYFWNPALKEKLTGESLNYVSQHFGKRRASLSNKKFYLTAMFQKTRAINNKNRKWQTFFGDFRLRSIPFTRIFCWEDVALENTQKTLEKKLLPRAHAKPAQRDPKTKVFVSLRYRSPERDWSPCKENGRKDL